MTENTLSDAPATSASRGAAERDAKAALRGLVAEINTIQRQAARLGLQAISARTSQADRDASALSKRGLLQKVTELRSRLGECPAEYRTTSAVRNAGSALDSLERRLELQA